jgi:hypothetical protein
MIARVNGKKVIANSIPKGGTHLLIQCLMNFPDISYSGYHYTTGRTNSESLNTIFLKTKKGFFSAAHLWWSKEAAIEIEKTGIRQIVMIRDPRDIIVSGVHYILKNKKHHLHSHFIGLGGMKERIIHYIKGVEKKYSSKSIPLADIRTSYYNYYRWIDEKSSLIVRFEDLVGPKGGEDEKRQKEVVENIAMHCGMNYSLIDIEKIASKVFSSYSVTFRRGKSGGWRDVFSKEVEYTFENVAGNLLSEVGYS